MGAPPAGFDHLLVFVLAVFFPLRAATFGYRRLALAGPADVARVRRALFLQALVLQWGFALLLLAVWAAWGRSWAALGLAPRSAAGLLAGVGVFAALAFWLAHLRRRARRDPPLLAAYLEKARHLERILPRTRAELRLFYAVSVTAGICEELLFRGYLIWYFEWLSGPIAAVILSSALFGVGHLYQGWKGMLATGLAGALFAGVYLLSGSLWPAMLIHALTDVHAGSLAHSALTAPSPAALEAIVLPGEASGGLEIPPPLSPPEPNEEAGPAG